MSYFNNADYDDFDLSNIVDNDNNPSSGGWSVYDEANEKGTPLSETNLNEMLKMLVAIRNVIGETTDFDTKINSNVENVSKPNIDTQKSIATYLREAFAAIIGTEADSKDTLSLHGLKSSVDIDFIYAGNAESIKSPIEPDNPEEPDIPDTPDEPTEPDTPIEPDTPT